MAEKVKVGDKVEWGTSQGKTRGVVKKKLTSPTKIKGHKVAASKDDPEYLVESSKSGGQAAHSAKSLKKVSSKSTAKKSSSAKKSAKKSAKSGAAKKPSSSKKSSGSGTPKKSSAKKPGKKTSGTKSGAAKAKAGGTTAKKTARKSSAKKSLGSTSSKKSTKSGTAKKGSAKNDDDHVINDFKKLVNMAPDALEKWLGTDDSKKVGFKDEGKGESVGHESGKKILKIKAKRKDKYTDDDLKHIHKVVGYIKRHLAQKPKGDISASNWRYSLMNWGHDPTK